MSRPGLAKPMLCFAKIRAIRACASKRVHASRPICSVRIAIGVRALGIRDGDTVIWFWIGSHSDYDGLIS